MKNERNYSIDLLKCVSMLMIVFLHITGYGLSETTVPAFSVLSVASDLLHAISIIGVNCFILISGYYLSKKEISLNLKSLLDYYKRLIPLWCQVLMYSFGIFIILCLFPGSGIQFSVKSAIKQTLVVFSNQYWFFTQYFLLIILSPFLNKLISCLEKSEYCGMLIVLVAVFSIAPSIIPFDSFSLDNGFSIMWFVALYLIAGFIRKYELPKKHLCKKAYIISTVLLFCCFVLRKAFSIWYFSGLLNMLCGQYNSLLVLIAAVSLFCIFVNSKRDYKKTGRPISLVASLCFGVYLLHEHPLFRDILWRKIICLENFADNQLLCVFVMIISAFSIYLAGISIEFIRSRLIRFLVEIFKKVRKRSR